MSRIKYDANKDRWLALDEKTGKWKPERRKVKDKFDFSKGVNFVPDIKEFVAHATDRPVLIGSRSQLRAYERSNNMRQAGDFKPGEIIGNRQNKIERDMREASRLSRETKLRGNVQHVRWV